MITPKAETRLTVTDPRSPTRPSYSRVAEARTPAATLLALLATAILALALTGRAGAAPPCADAIVADWFDNGRIDRLYALPCYEQAIDAVPSEIRDYTDAQEVISRAFQAASGHRLETRAPRSPAIDSSPPPTTAPVVATSSPSAIPIPLLALAGLATALLAAGGLGYLSRRRRGHDPDSHR